MLLPVCGHAAACELLGTCTRFCPGSLPCLPPPKSCLEGMLACFHMLGRRRVVVNCLYTQPFFYSNRQSGHGGSHGELCWGAPEADKAGKSVYLSVSHQLGYVPP